MGERMVAGPRCQFLWCCVARLRLYHTEQAGERHLVYHTSRAGEVLCRDVEDFARHDSLSAERSAF